MLEISNPFTSHFRARWWQMRADGRIECTLCPRRCKLRDGQHGFCVVRRRVGDHLELGAYGRSSGFCIDPIEKKPLYHFLPGTSALSFGTTGCNLGCRFCQNWDITKVSVLARLSEEAAPEQIVAVARQHGCRSVAFTYNDPVISAEYAIDIARVCHAEGIKTVAVTAGYISDEARMEFFDAMDAANVDLKAFDDDFYRRFTWNKFSADEWLLCPPVVSLGGDGAMYDIGFQSLSRMVASGSDIKVLVLDTQVYSNTGGQASTASFGGQITKMSAFGKSLHGRPERRKELARIMMAHGEVYVAQTSAAHINHFYRSIIEANEYPGPAVIVAYTPCQPEHGIGDDASTRQAKLAVDSRAFPLFTYDPRRGESMAERLSLQGNPAMKEDWSKAPDGTPVDFLAFARTEGRFRQHFGEDGSVTPEIQSTQEDRLAYWHALQELAGIR